MVKAVNPETGETLVYRDGQWQPDVGGKIAVNPQTGQRLEYKDGSWKPLGAPASQKKGYTYDPERESPFGLRAAASVRMTPEGQAEYLKTVHGPENVDITGETVFIRDPETMTEYRHDIPGATWTDVADVVPDLVQMAPELAVGLTRANPWLAAGTAAIGSLGRSAADFLMPGESQLTPRDVLAQAGMQGLLGGGAQLGSNVLFGAADIARPQNIISGQLTKGQDTPFAKEGMQLEQQTGVQLTPGQITGARAPLMLEGAVRRYPTSAQKMVDFEERQLEQATSRLTNIMDNIAGVGESAVVRGEKVAGAVGDALSRARSLRKKSAKRDFDAVKNVAGKSKIIPTSSAISEIDSLISTFDVPGGGDATASLVNKLKKLKKKLTVDGTPRRLNVDEYQRLLEVYGKASRGSGQIFKDIDNAQQRMIAGRVFNGLQKDLDNVADGASTRADIAEGLRMARNNYRMNSEAIDNIKTTVLGRMIGRNIDPSPEALSMSFSKMTPSEINASMKTLNVGDPNAVTAVRRGFIQDMMESSVPTTGAAAGQTFSPNKFVTQFNKNKDRLKAVLGPDEYRQVGDVAKVLGRISDKALTDAPSTAQQLQTFEFIQNAMSTMMNPKAGLIWLMKNRGMNKIADAMTSPQGRRDLQTLAKTPNWTKGSAAAATRLGILMSDNEPTETQ